MTYLKVYIFIYQGQSSCNAFGSSVLLVCWPKYFHLLSSSPFLLFLHPFTFILCLVISLAISVLTLRLKGNSFRKISSAVDMWLLAVHTSLPPYHHQHQRYNHNFQMQLGFYSFIAQNCIPLYYLTQRNHVCLASSGISCYMS